MVQQGTVSPLAQSLWRLGWSYFWKFAGCPRPLAQEMGASSGTLPPPRGYAFSETAVKVVLPGILAASVRALAQPVFFSWSHIHSRRLIWRKEKKPV